MTKNIGRTALLALVLLALLLATLQGPVVAQNIRQQFEWIVAKRLTVNTTADVAGKATVGGALTVAGNVNAGGSLTTTGAVNVGTLLRLAPAGTAVLAADGTLTPAGSYQPISSTAAIGTAAIATTTLAAGTLLYVVNVGAQTITFTDTGSLKLGGNAALGGGDTLLLVNDGTAWNQVSKTDN